METERLIEEIQTKFRPGMVRWIRKSPRHWKRLLELEEWIDRHGSNQNEKLLIRTLKEYSTFLSEVLFLYKNGGTESWGPQTLR